MAARDGSRDDAIIARRSVCFTGGAAPMVQRRDCPVNLFNLFNGRWSCHTKRVRASRNEALYVCLSLINIRRCSGRVHLERHRPGLRRDCSPHMSDLLYQTVLL